MTVLTNFPAIPNRIAIACEYLQDCGDQGIARDVFESQLSPAPSGADDEERSGTSMAREVLRELEAFGIAVQTEGGIRLSPELPAKGMAYQQWMAWLLPWIGKRVTDTELADQVRQQGVPLAFAWLLCQDARKPIRSSGAHTDLLQQQFGDVDALGFNMRNDQIFQNLIYWARYLGFAETLGLRSNLYVVPDPTRAIGRVLPEVFRESADLAVDAFVERVAILLPVLEGGSARTDVENRMRNSGRADQHFSVATSLALRRLEQRGLLQLGSESDTQRWVLDNGRNVTRLVWQRGAA